MTLAKQHKGHATRGGFRGSRGMGAGTGGGMAGGLGMDAGMAGGAPSTDGSEALAPGETGSMPAPMPSGPSDPDAGSPMPPGGGLGLKRGGRAR